MNLDNFFTPSLVTEGSGTVIPEFHFEDPDTRYRSEINDFGSGTLVSRKQCGIKNTHLINFSVLDGAYCHAQRGILELKKYLSLVLIFKHP